MTKFFKTLEELKASLPTTVNLWPNGCFNALSNGTPALIWGGIETPKTTVIVNCNNLEKYVYTGSLTGSLTGILSPAWAKSVNYDFKLLETCPISNYESLIESKDTFEATLPKEYIKEFSFSDLLTGADKKKEVAFFAQKTAIVTNGDKFQEILYTPIKNPSIDSSWFFSSGKWEVEYQSEVVSEAPISEVLAEFGL